MYYDIESKKKQYELLKKIYERYTKRKTADIQETKLLGIMVVELEAEIITYEKRNPKSK